MPYDTEIFIFVYNNQRNANMQIIIVLTLIHPKFRSFTSFVRSFINSLNNVLVKESPCLTPFCYIVIYNKNNSFINIKDSNTSTGEIDKEINRPQ